MRPLLLAAPFAFAAALLAGDPTPDDVERAIRQLGDNRHTTREQAANRLWQYGRAAEAAVRRAAQGEDAEIARRARTLLDKFDAGIYPDTPPAIRTQIEAFLAAVNHDDATERRRGAIDELVKVGKPGFLALLKLRSKWNDTERYLLTTGIHRAALVAAADLDPAAAEALFAASVEADDDDLLSHYTATVLLRGRLAEAVARWQAEPDRAKADAVLAHLRRAGGDWPAARKHAEATGRTELLDAILWEQGDWKALARRRILPGVRETVFVGVGAQALLHRMAGEDAEADAALADLRRLATEEAAVPALLLNGRVADVADAVDRATKVPDKRPIAFDVLTAQFRFADATAVAETPEDPDKPTPKLLEIKFAIHLHQLGETTRAGQEFARIVAELESADDRDTANDLMRAQMRVGLKAAAREAAGDYLGRVGPSCVDGTDPTRPLLDTVFPKLGDEARTWWLYLRQRFPKEDGLATMKRLTTLLDPGRGAAGPGEFADGLLAAADGPVGMAQARFALAAAHEAAGRTGEAIRWAGESARGSDDFLFWLRHGDLLAGQKRYAEAAVAYAGAWQRDPGRTGVPPEDTAEDTRRDDLSFLAPYLHGWALQQAGRGGEATAQLERAHRLPLGDAKRRARVAAELSKRDLPDLAKRERDLIRRLGWYRAWASGNLLTQWTREALAAKDFSRAADYYERLAAALLANGYTFSDAGAYLAVPAAVRTFRARAALSAGKIDEALGHAAAGLALSPGHQDVATLLVSELDRRGRNADAESLYRKAAGPYEAMAKEYPQSAFAHNGAAWVAACCHRDLDAALAHAERAVELAPTTAGYLDTLAEVHFQRGERDKALDAMRRCRAMEPTRGYFRRQLARFEAGDKTVPPPEDED